MKISLSVDELERLICRVEDGASPVMVTASDADAAAHLIAAIDDTAQEGAGECFWEEGGGDYRWMLRRDGDNLRVVVLWCAGTLTGWETVLWRECDFETFRQQVQCEVARLQPVG